MMRKLKINKNKIGSATLVITILFAIISSVFIGAFDYVVPNEKSVQKTLSISDNISEDEQISEITGRAKLCGIPLKSIEVNVIPNLKVIPCGSVFGVKYFTKGVIIVGMSDVESTEGILNPAYKSGLRVGDVITKINGTEVNTIEEVADMVDKSAGEKLTVDFLRNGESGQTTLIPLMSLTEGKYKTGLWIRDSTAGIGTITYYNPDTGNFGGLGHGICDVDTGELMPLLRANVVDISVTDIIKGIDGVPGEIKGSFGIIKAGSLYKNTEVGVFGNLINKPKCAFDEPIDVGESSSVHEGEAYIYSSLGDDNIHKFKIELTKIYRNNSTTKNFIFSVVDNELLSRTGGIVQGMSGSPIIQDGKLIGAVTHVLVNNPEKGYGIFIENMLTASAE